MDKALQLDAVGNHVHALGRHTVEDVLVGQVAAGGNKVIDGLQLPAQVVLAQALWQLHLGDPDVRMAAVALGAVLAQGVLGGDARAVDAKPPVVVQGQRHPDAPRPRQLQDAQREAGHVVGVDHVRLPVGDQLEEDLLDLGVRDIVAQRGKVESGQGHAGDGQAVEDVRLGAVARRAHAVVTGQYTHFMATVGQRPGLMVGNDFCAANHVRREEVGDHQHFHASIPPAAHG